MIGHHSGLIIYLIYNNIVKKSQEFNQLDNRLDDIVEIRRSDQIRCVVLFFPDEGSQELDIVDVGLNKQMQTNSSTNFIVQPENNNKTNAVDLAFQSVTYIVQEQIPGGMPWSKQHRDKTIIHDVSGIFKAGEVSAIMGASGAGKTTLLNLIACRMSLQSGSVKANNMTYNYENFGNFANYVMQADILLGTLTVRETLMFAANLKLNSTEQQKQKKIGRLVQQLKLDRCIDTLVGTSTLKGISGGEKKRCNIAFELISDPDILILDEPTSGLDSLTSFIIVQYLHNMVRQRNKTVIMTIHQPNSQIYDLFDRLFLMVEGHLIYQGQASTAVDYFDRHFGLKCPDVSNPADYFISIMHHQDRQNRERYPRYIETYKKNMLPTVREEIKQRRMEHVKKREIEVSTSTIYKELIIRDFKNVIRQPLHTKSRVFQNVFIWLYIGGMYFNEFDSGVYVTDVAWFSLTGFFAFISMDVLMQALVPITITFQKQRQNFLKEENSKLYTTTAYFISRNITEMPYAVIFPIIMLCIGYWMVGLTVTVEKIFIFLLILYLLTFAGMAFGLFLGSVVHQAKLIGSFVPVIAIMFNLFSGFYKNFNSIPQWISWIQYLSPFRYGFQAFIENQVDPATSRIAQFNFSLSLWSAIGLLAVLGIAFRALSLFFLWYLRTSLQ